MNLKNCVLLVNVTGGSTILQGIQEILLLSLTIFQSFVTYLSNPSFPIYSKITESSCYSPTPLFFLVDSFHYGSAILFRIENLGNERYDEGRTLLRKSR